MKFYELEYFEDENQENPSIQNFRDGYDTDSVNSATHIRHYKKIDFKPDLDFILDKKGRATDRLAPSFIGSEFLLVTPKFYDVLCANNNILGFQCFDAVVRNGERLLPYYFLHFYFRFDCDENDLVDFSKTKFIAEKTTFPLSLAAVPTDEEGVLGEFKVDSWHKYHELREKTENDYVHKIILPLNTLYIKQRKFIELDLFYLEFGNFGMHNFVVSEKLAKLIDSKGITGVRIKPLSFEIEIS